jgi:hypothetical protein
MRRGTTTSLSTGLMSRNRRTSRTRGGCGRPDHAELRPAMLAERRPCRRARKAPSRARPAPSANSAAARSAAGRRPRVPAQDGVTARCVRTGRMARSPPPSGRSGRAGCAAGRPREAAPVQSAPRRPPAEDRGGRGHRDRGPGGQGCPHCRPARADRPCSRSSFTTKSSTRERKRAARSSRKRRGRGRALPASPRGPSSEGRAPPPGAHEGARFRRRRGAAPTTGAEGPEKCRRTRAGRPRTGVGRALTSWLESGRRDIELLGLRTDFLAEGLAIRRTGGDGPGPKRPAPRRGCRGTSTDSRER